MPEAKTADIEKKLKEKEAQIVAIDKRRRLISFQHENGGLTKAEYLRRLEHIKKEETHLKDQLIQLRNFGPTAEPPEPEVVKEALSNISTFPDALGCFLAKAVPLISLALTNGKQQQEKLQLLVEQLDVKGVIYPDDNEEGFKIDVFVNIPIEPKSLEDYPMIMVSPSSAREDLSFSGVYAY